MDSWASTIARGMINGPQSTWVATWVAPPFFVLFIFIAGIVMTNVVVAILLEKYLSATHSRNRAKQKQKDRAKQKQKAKANRRKRSKARRLPMNGDSKSTGGEVFPEQPLSPGGKRRWRQALSLAKATAKAKISARHEVQQVQKAHSQHIRKIKKSIEHTLGHVKHTSYRGSRSPSNRLVQDNDSFEAWNQSDSASALSKTNADNEMQFHHLSEVTEAELADIKSGQSTATQRRKATSPVYTVDGILHPNRDQLISWIQDNVSASSMGALLSIGVRLAAEPNINFQKVPPDLVSFIKQEALAKSIHDDEEPLHALLSLFDDGSE